MNPLTPLDKSQHFCIVGLFFIDIQFIQNAKTVYHTSQPG